jgi:hypothetical protein
MPITTIITVPPKTDPAFHPNDEDPAAAGWGPRPEATRPPGTDSSTRFHPARKHGKV